MANANATFRRRPRIVQPIFGHPILRDQACWFVANNRAPSDILRKFQTPGTAGAGITLGQVDLQPGWIGDGTATGFLDLGSTNRFISSTTQPFTVAWVESHAGAQANAGILNLFPNGGTPATKSFAILRTNNTGVGPTASYGALSCGPWVAAAALVGFPGSSGGGPTVLTDNVPCVFVLTCAGGPYSVTAADYTVYWTGNQYVLKKVAVTAGNSGALGSTNNYFGWDNIDNKYVGLLDNLRIWNRVLSEHEIWALLKDPYLGCYRQRPHVYLELGDASEVISRYYIAC